MEPAIVIVVIAVALIIWHLVQINSNEDDESKEGRMIKAVGGTVPTIEVPTEDALDNNEYKDMDTPTLMRAVLKKLNCKCQENDDGTIFFEYQGESFWLSSSKDSSWVRVIDINWYNCSLDNLEEISCMQKAINSANAEQSCTAVYSIDKENNKMIVYSKADLLISTKLPGPDEYLYAWLSQFFQLKQKVVIEFEKEKQIIKASCN